MQISKDQVSFLVLMGLKSYGQWLDSLVESYDGWCPSEVCTGTSAKGLSALSASLPMTSNCGVANTAGGKGCYPEGPGQA